MADWITGPEATIVVSLVAALFAAAIYSAAKKLIEGVRGGRGSRIEDANFFRQHCITLDEARFFFDCEIQSFLRNIMEECEAYSEPSKKKTIAAQTIFGIWPSKHQGI
jgi:hypothetical protein